MPWECQSPASTEALVSTEEIAPAVSQKERRSCDLVKTPAPCVKKALFHLGRLKELLRFVLENPLKKFGERSDDVMQKFLDKCPKGWKQLEFVSRWNPSWSSDSLSMTDSNDSGFGVQDIKLEINGIGGQLKDIAEQGDSESKVHISRLERRNQLSPQEIFDQVHKLILRLAEDRMRTRLGLDAANVRVDAFQEKIDDICSTQLRMLPQAVQKVHEATAANIGNLQWHVWCMQHELETSKRNLEVERVSKIQMQEEIAFVKLHCPLVEEKLSHEQSDIEKITAVLSEAKKELADAKLELLKIETKYRETKATVEMERQLTRSKIEGIHRMLHLLRMDLHHSLAMETAYEKKANQCRQKLLDLEQDLAIFERRADEAREEERNEKCVLDDVANCIRQVELQISELMKKNVAAEDEMRNMVDGMDADVEALKATYNITLRNLRRIQEENKDVKLDIEDMNKEIATSDKVMAKCAKEVIRYKRERNRCDAMLEEASRDAESVTMAIRELKMELCMEENKSQAAEDALKTQVESLKRRALEARRQRFLFMEKSKSNSRALRKRKTSNKEKQGNIGDFIIDTDRTAFETEEFVGKLKVENEHKMKEVAGLELKLAAMNGEFDEKLKVVIVEKNSFLGQKDKLSAVNTSLRAKVDQMEFDNIQMSKELEALTETNAILSKRVAVAAIYVSNQTEVLKKVTVRLEAARKLDKELQRQLNAAKERLVHLQREHRNMTESRIDAERALEASIEEEWVQNKRLAQRHRDMQSEHIDVKNKLSSLYDDKLILEASIKDHKQVLALQQKFSTALRQYFHDREEFNVAELEKFTAESEDSASEAARIRSNLKIALGGLSNFLRSHFRENASEKVHKDAMKLLLNYAVET